MTRRFRDGFLTLDLRSLGLFRILLGVLLLHDACVRWGHLEAFYTARGVLPAGSLPAGYDTARSLLDFIDAPLAVRGFFVVAMAAFFALMVGWRTRVASVVALVAFASIRNRNVFVSHGGDATLLVLLVWSVFLPLGARFSCDAVRAALRRGVDLDAPRPTPLALRSVPGLAALALMLQMGLIYLTTAVAKSGPTWRDGTAVYYALELDVFALPLGVAMRALPLALTKLATWGTLGLEYAALPFLFAPWGWLRRVTLALLVAMHVGHALTLSIGGFPWAMMCGLVVFLRAEEWAWIAARARRGARAVTLVYDDACGFCTRVCRIVKLADAGGRVRFVGASARSALAPTVSAASAAASAVAVDAATGVVATRAAAAARVAGALPWPWRAAVLLDAPGVRVVTNLVYDLVARNRGRISTWCGDVACGVAPPAGGATAARNATATAAPGGARIRARAADAAVAVLLVAMLADAYQRRLVTRFDAPRIATPAWMPAIVAALDIRSGWPMFAPDPLAADGWWVVEGVASDGSTYDPLAHGPVTWQRPPRLATRHDPYWRAYLLNMSLPGNYPIRTAFGRYLAHRAAADGQPLERLDFAYVQEMTQPPGSARPFPTKTIRLWEYDARTDQARGPTPASLR